MRNTPRSSSPNGRHIRQSSAPVRAFVVAVFFLSFGMAQRMSAQELRAVTWNICGIHCYHGEIDNAYMVQPIIQAREINADVVSLQEVTLAQAINLAYAMGYRTRNEIMLHLQFVRAKRFESSGNDRYYFGRLPRFDWRQSDFGSFTSPFGGYPSDYGNAIVTGVHYPIKSRDRVLLPSTPYDPKDDNPELTRVPVVGIQVGGNMVRIYDMHTAQVGSHRDIAISQMHVILSQISQDAAAASPSLKFRPVLMGDFNMVRPSPSDTTHPYNILKSKFKDSWFEWSQSHPNARDTGATTRYFNPNLRLDYIFFDNRSAVEVSYARTLNDPLNLEANYYTALLRLRLFFMQSDHYPVFARLTFR